MRCRSQDHWRDHGLGSSHTANPQITVFTPKFSPYRSLWTMNDPNGPQTLWLRIGRGGYFSACASTFLAWYVHPFIVSPRAQERESARTFIS